MSWLRRIFCYFGLHFYRMDNPISMSHGRSSYNAETNTHHWIPFPLDPLQQPQFHTGKIKYVCKCGKESK